MYPNWRIMSKTSKTLKIAGVLLCAFPFGLQKWNQYEMDANVQTIHTQIQKKDTKMDAIWKSALVYNENLFMTQSQFGYEQELNPLQDGYMATVEIPKINVLLPIYHGTDEDVLMKGIGHVKWSCLPVGGMNSHAILTGHSGSASHAFFTPLDRLEIKDQILIQVCNRKLEYEVFDIEVILPEQLESLKIKAGEDQISLITCTPFGINTHRLVVHAKRKMDV